MDGYIKKKTLINRLGTLISDGKINLDTAVFILGHSTTKIVSIDNPALTYNNCINLIAREVSSLGIKPVEKSTFQPCVRPRVLIKPNPYQTLRQFIEAWVRSLLTTGNTYVLREKDNRGSLKYLHIIDSKDVVVLTATDGSVWYEIGPDNIVGLPEKTRIPASEIVHDRINAYFHPLVGLSPVYAASCSIGFTDQKNLSDVEIIEAVKWSSEITCSIFHIPPYKIGIGPYPIDNNVIKQEEARYQNGIVGIIKQNICYHLERLLDDTSNAFIYFDDRFDKTKK